MTKPKTLDQLRAEKERAETQLAQEQHKLERLENRKKYLEKGERTKRTHRPVSYTHLDVYKRQIWKRSDAFLPYLRKNWKSADTIMRAELLMPL